MQLRTVLIILFALGFLALVALLPRTPLVLGWLWLQAERIAAEQGYTLSAGQLTGNAWGGISIENLSLSGPGLQLSSDSTRLEYGLISLLGGRLSVGADLNGLHGHIDPARLPLSSGTDADGPALPIDLHRLSLGDVDITIAEYDLYLPDVSIDELSVSTEGPDLDLNASLSTPHGQATVSGSWLSQQARLELDINGADVSIARYWWPGALEGTLTGQLRADASGVELDGFITDGVVDYLELLVTDISGPVTMRDLIIDSELTGRALDGQVQADISVDIPQLNYHGLLTGNPRLEAAVPWLGRNLAVDLTGIAAAGPMSLRTVVTGWYETQVTGTASGSGSLLGLELDALLGDFGYSSALGVSVDVDALLAGGDVTVQLRPGLAEAGQLNVNAGGVLLADGPATTLQLDGQLFVNLDTRPEFASQPGAGQFTLSGQLGGAPLELQLQGHARSLNDWHADLSGSLLEQPVISGTAALDFAAGVADALVEVTELELNGLPWPLDATLTAVRAPLQFPLPFSVAASSGPLTLASLDLELDPLAGLALAAPDSSFSLLHREGLTRLEFDAPPLSVSGLPGGTEELQLTGGITRAGDNSQADLLLALAGLELELSDFTEDMLEGTVRSAADSLAFSFQPGPLSWQLEGDVPVEALATLLGWPVSGRLSGAMSGRAAEPAAGSFSGDVKILGQQLGVQLTGDGGRLLLDGETGLLGADWQLSGELLPAQDLRAVSALGSLELSGDELSGGGSLLLPDWLTHPTGRPDWQLTGSLAGQSATLSSAGSSLTASWADGLSVSGTVSEQLAVYGAEVRLEANLAADGELSGSLVQGTTSVQLAGRPVDGTLTFSGQLPAALLHGQLAGSVSVSGRYDWLAEPALVADLTWQQLDGAVSWQPGTAPELHVRGPGLELSLSSGQLSAGLTDFAADPYVQLPLAGLLVSGSATGPLQQLQLELNGRADWLQAQLQGTFGLNDNALSFSASGWDGLLELNGQLAGSVAEPAVSARLRSSQLGTAGLFEVQPLELDVTLTAAGDLLLSGSAGELILSDGSWSGSLNLPLHIMTEQHRLHVEPAGEGALPQLTGRLSGPTLHGELTLDEHLGVELQLTQPLAWLEQASLNGQLALNGTFSARLDAAADAPLEALSPLTLGAELSGDLSGFSGFGNIRSGPAAERLLTITATGDLGSVVIGADLASLDLAVLSAATGIDASLKADGDAALILGPTLDWQLQGSLAGTVGSVPLQLQLSGGDDVLNVSGPVAAEQLSLSIDAAEELRLSGSWAGAELQAASAGEQVEGSLLYPAGQTELTFSLRTHPTGVELQQLSGQVAGAALTVSGPLQPEAALSGNLSVPALSGELPLWLSSGPAGLEAGTRYEQLQLTALYDAAGLQLNLSGQPGSPGDHIQLGWSPATGFSGDLNISYGLPRELSARLTASATADGQLQLDGLLHDGVSNRQLGELNASLAAQPLRPDSLSGRLSATAELSGLLPGLSERRLSLSSSSRLSGSLTAPRLAGSVLLLGGIQAEGRLSADLAGLDVNLSGPAVELNAGSDWRSWHGQLTLSQLPLDRLTDVLSGASLELQADGSGDFSVAGSRLDLSRLEVSTAQSTVSGSGELSAGELSGQLDVALFLADLNVGAELTGGASGRISLDGYRLDSADSGTISGGLDLTGAGIAGAFGLDGRVAAGGSLAEPQLSAALNGGDDLLELDWQPAAGRLRLVGRLDSGPVRSDVSVQLSPEAGFSAAGTISVPGGFFTLSSSPSGDLELLGREAWSDWQLQLDPNAGQLSVRGDLAGVRPELAGALSLDANLTDAGAGFSGSLTGLQVLGIDLGSVPISTAASGRGVKLSGERLAGRLLLSGDWQLTRLVLELSDDLNMVASGSGDLKGGILDASLAGRLLDRSVLGTAAAQLSPAGLNVTALFSLLGGSASLDARFREGSWHGSVSLNDLLYGGVSLNGHGNLSGPLAEPQLQLSTGADLLGLSGQGEIRLGPGLFSLQHSFTDPGLGGTLSLQASLYPEPQLQLSGPDGNVFSLEQARADDGRPVARRELHASGELNISGEAAQLSLSATDSGAAAEVFLGLSLLPGLAVDGTLQLGSLEQLLAQLDEGIQLGGLEETFGDLSLNLLAGQLLLNDFGFRHPLVTVQASGNISLTGSSRISGQLTAAPGPLADLPALAGESTIPFALISGTDLFRLVSTSNLGDVEVSFNTSSGAGTLEALLRSGGGTAEARLSWNQATGVAGNISADGFVLFELADGPPGTIDSALQLSAGRATGYAELRVGQGQLTASGHWGLADLLPAGLASGGVRGGEFSVRMGSFELSELPALARWAPALQGSVTAVIQISDDVVAGNVAATGLSAGGAPVPIEALISGTLADIRIAGSLSGSPLTLTLADGQLSGLLEMRRFPLHTLAAAVAGQLDVLAEVTGVARFNLPLGRIGDSEFRVATEQVRLERSGIVTTGNVSMELSSGEFRVSEARFSGAGAWEAAGVLRADELDFSLEAEDADFGPMLGLIPVLSQLQVAAEGSLSLNASGSLAEPMISLVSEQLEFELAGISYRLEDLTVQLQQSQLTVAAALLATDPIQGALNLSGASGISLSPLAFQDARFTFAGSLVLPFVGQVEAIQGSIHSADGSPGAPLLTEVQARLGNPLTVSGSLAPLDLDVRGQDLLLDLPSILLTDSRLDADLNLAYLNELLELSGNIVLHESTISLNQAGSGPGLTTDGVATRLRFNELQIEAPARLRLAESFGSAELSGSLTVTGTLAEPLLSGRADALRGTFQFAGRDFELQEASALFDVTRGLYPELRLTAVTSFDRNRLLPAGSTLQLISPSDGSAQVTLSFTGTVEPDPLTGIRLSLDPLLSSNIIVQDARTDGLPSGARPLTDDELLALITLGRAELGGIAGDAGLAPLVAQGALETAVDMLLLSELQRALGEALGLDLVEIRSSALTNLLSGDGADQQFGISLRFGGYVSDEVFATYRLSAFDDPDGLYAFSNELGIRYALGPVVLDLTGSLNVPEATTLGAVAQLSLGVLYEINPRTSLEAAFDLSGDEQQFRFGVTWRW